GSCCSYSPSGDECQISISAPAIGLPFVSFTVQSTNNAGPGVGERMIEPPFSVRGEFSRQKWPSRLAVVSVWPLLPLLSRQTSAEKPSEPDISTTSLWVALLIWPSLATICAPAWNSSSV